MVLVYLAAVVLVFIFLAGLFLFKAKQAALRELADQNAEQLKVSVRAWIIYEDARKVVTEREITICFVQPTSREINIRAFCKLRQDFRHFKASRIKYFTDTDTGEEVEDIHEYLLAKAKENSVA
ncbi:hypothetical protein ACES2L_02275 [Bdellovibrio bacteriovorus]